LIGAADFHETGLRPVAKQEAVVIDGVVVVHAAAGMAGAQVALVQRQLFVAARRWQHLPAQVGIALEAAALVAVGLEAGAVDADRHAGLALRALRPVQQVARAPEAPAQPQWIQPGQPRVVRVDHQVACGTQRPVATRVRGALEQSQLRGRSAH